MEVKKSGRRILNAGLAGVYSIAINSFEHKGTNATLLQGLGAYKDIRIAGETIELERANQIVCVDYEKAWKNAVIVRHRRSAKYIMVDFDDTPRRGKAGWLMRGVTLEIFEGYAY